MFNYNNFNYSSCSFKNQVNILCNVNVNFNFTVNNFYAGEENTEKQDEPVNEDFTETFYSEEEKAEGPERTEEIPKLLKSNLSWDWAEAEEENINDIKEKYLPCKLDTLRLEHIYQYLERYDKAYNAHKCGTYLEFELKYGQTIDKKKLRRINSCKQRLCTYCSWRKSLRIYTNIRKCFDEILRRDKGKKTERTSRFIFMTLTTRNCSLEGLNNEVNLQLKGFDKLRRYKAFKNAFKGFIRALEVVIDREPLITPNMYLQDEERKAYYDNLGLGIGDENPNYMMCNVHIHVLLHTTYDIYQGNNYITKDKLISLWKRACNLNYDPRVDIRSFKAKNREEKGKELAEMAKYTVKPKDYLRAEYVVNRIKRGIFDEDFINDCRSVMYLDGALSGRRLFALGGSFKEVHQELELDDEKMIDDLNEDEKSEAITEILKYYFSFKQKKYIRIVGK